MGPGATGDVVRVVDDGHWRGGPPFGFLFPLPIIGLIVLLIAGLEAANRAEGGAVVSFRLPAD